MLAVLDEVVALFIPELGVGFLVDSGFGQEDKELREIGYVNVVPARFALADDGNILGGEDEVG